jgi:hypothetical protein
MNTLYYEFRKKLINIIESIEDLSPIGEIYPSEQNPKYETSYISDAIDSFIKNNSLNAEDFLLWNINLSSNDLRSNRISLSLNNTLSRYYLNNEDYDRSYHYAMRGFSIFHMDVFNHRLLVAAKAGPTEKNNLSNYLDTVYCPRPFNFVELTNIDKAFLCSSNFLTAPFADFGVSRGGEGSNQKPVVDSFWNSKQAKYIRRSIIAGEFAYCSPTNCPRIQSRTLPKRLLDHFEILGDDPHLIMSDFYRFNIFYFNSRVYAIPLRLEFNFMDRINDNILVSYSIRDLENQIFDLLQETEEFDEKNNDNLSLYNTKRSINLSWFIENGVESSVVLGLGESDQAKITEYVTHTPKEIMLAYDNSCNISCPSCRNDVIVASKGQNEKYDRLIPLLIDLIADANYIICSGSGDPFASKHYRKLIAAICGMNPDKYGSIYHNSNFKINLMTNGLALTRRSYDELGLKGFIGDISLSMDSCEKPSYEKIRRGSKWEDLIAAIDFLKTIKQENPFFNLISYFTVQRENFKQIPEFVDFCKQNGFNHVSLNMPQNWGTYTSEEFESINVGSEYHPCHKEFLDILRHPSLDSPYINLGGASQLRSKALGIGNFPAG